MPLTDNVFTYDKLGIIGINGIDTAAFPQIRDAIAARMREIYGEDIDLSTASADGQYIMMESLVMNNVYRLIDNLYKNMDPFTASGKFLDILCSLTNVTRKTNSRSIAKIYVKNTGVSDFSESEIVLNDRNGKQWIWKNPTDLSGNPMVVIESGEIELLSFSCEEYGTVVALGTGVNVTDAETDIPWDNPNFTSINGFIYETTEVTFLKVYQSQDAEVGNNDESDASLRSRRYSYLGSNSVTTQASLQSALFNLSSIEDVYIFNNVTGSNQTLADGITVPNHNVYICLRYKKGVSVDNSIIGPLVYGKMTPGVITTSAASAQSGVGREKEINLYSGISTTVYWKECVGVHPDITINFDITNKYLKASGTERYSSTEIAICNQLKSFLNSVKINEKLLPSSIQTIMNGADPTAGGFKTFWPTGCTINDDVTEYLAPLTYYDYIFSSVTGEDSDFTFTYDPDYPLKGTLTISRT